MTVPKRFHLSALVVNMPGIAHALANLLQGRQPLSEMMCLVLELVVDFSHLLLQHAVELAVQVGGGQAQIGLTFAAIALHLCPSMSRDFEHGDVFAQCVNKQHPHPLVASVCGGMVEQLDTYAPASLM